MRSATVTMPTMRTMAIVLVGALGCAEPQLTTSEQGILFGTPADQAMIERFGALTVAHEAGFVTLRGSGVLLENGLGLTAGHVVDDLSYFIDPVVAQLGPNDTWHPARRVYQFGNTLTDAQGRHGPDLAVLLFDSDPFTIDGSTTGFTRVIGEAQVGDRLFHMGIGYFMPDGYSDDAMRWGRDNVSLVNDEYIKHTPDEVYGWTTTKGDSGGPSFVDDALVGIHSLVGDIAACTPPRPPAGCIAEDVKLFDLFWAIQAVSLPWPVRAAGVFDVQGIEIRANREIEYDLDTAPWNELARISNKLCTNRSGIAAGHYNGHQSNGRYGVVCSARTGVMTEMVPPDDRNRHEPIIASLDSVGWAAAARLAHTLCENRNTVGGWFTGDVDANDNWRLACSTNGRYHTVTAAELNSLGWPVIGNLDSDVGFAQGLRAAFAYCVHHDYDAGFLTGSQIGDSYGVVCQTKPVLQ